MKHRLLVFALPVLAACVSWAQAGVTPAQGNEHSARDGQRSNVILLERNQRYRLQVGDTFDVDFALSPEFNQTVAVQPDGYGSFKAIGSVSVVNKTIPELTEAIKTAY